MTFHFTETEPTPLLKDFDTFARYLEQNSFALSKATEYLPYEHLAALNETMTCPNTENTPRTPQLFYPQLHLYYHLALAGRLFRKMAHKTQKKLQATKRLAAYRSLTPAEEYCFLLETLWMDCSWGALGDTRRSSFVIFAMHGFWERFCRLQPGSALLRNKDPNLLNTLSTLIPPALVHSFSFFGWHRLERDEALYQYHGVKSFFPIAALIPTELGITLAKILMRHRPLLNWNLSYLRGEGIPPAMKEYQDKAGTSFVELFRHICAKDELRSRLPREMPKGVQGNFVFRVNVAPKIWRTLALSSRHTLHDLHNENLGRVNTSAKKGMIEMNEELRLVTRIRPFQVRDFRF